MFGWVGGWVGGWWQYVILRTRQLAHLATPPFSFRPPQPHTQVRFNWREDPRWRTAQGGSNKDVPSHKAKYPSRCARPQPL